MIFKKELYSGLSYTAISKYSGVMVSIILGAVLARLLTPEEFGIIALITVFVSFFGLLSDFGLGPAVVQNQSLDDNDLKSIFSFSIALGIILALIFFTLAPFFANFYNEPELKPISRYLALSVLFNSFLIVPRAVLQKELKFKLIGLISLGVQLFCGVIAIILAILGFSFYSLVFQSILLGIISFITFYCIKPISITFKIEISSVKKIFKFSLFQFLFDFINYFSRNLDNILIGKFLGVSPLGFYEKSYRLMMMPVQNLTHVVSPVLLPILSKHQNDNKIVFSSYLKVIQILSIIGFPLSIFLFFSASEIIIIVFGSQWVESISVFKILTLTIGFQIVLSSSGSIFQAVNRTDLLFYSGFLSSLFMVGGILYGVLVGKSLELVAYSLILAFIINFFQCFYFLVKLALRASYKEFLVSFLPSLYLCLIVLLGLYLFDISFKFNDYTSLFLKIIVFSFSYFSIYLFLFKIKFIKIK